MTEDEAKLAFIQNLTDQLDKAFNPVEKKVGFVLLVFGIEGDAGCAVGTNGLSRDSVIEVLRTQADLLSKTN